MNKNMKTNKSKQVKTPSHKSEKHTTNKPADKRERKPSKNTRVATNNKRKLSEHTQVAVINIYNKVNITDIVSKKVKSFPNLQAFGVAQLIPEIEKLSDEELVRLSCKSLELTDDKMVIYQLAIRLWVGIAFQVKPELATYMKYCLIRDGLKGLISAGKEAYDEKFKKEKTPSHAFFAYACTISTDVYRLKDITTIMLFLSRLSVSSTDDKAIDEFLEIQNSLRPRNNQIDMLVPSCMSCSYKSIPILYDSEGYAVKYQDVLDAPLIGIRVYNSKYHTTFTDELFMSVADEYLSHQGFRTLKGQVLSSLWDDMMRLSAGANADASNILEKISKVNAINRDFWTMVTNEFDIEDLIELYHLEQEVMSVMCVPKNIDSSRVIAPGSVVTQAFGQHLQRAHMAAIEQANTCDRVAIMQQHQMVNREYAQRGSVSGEYATIDLSHASDLVYARLVKLAYERKAKFIYNFCPRNMKVRGKVRRCESFAPAGYCDTFNCESDIFKIICEMACVLVYDLGGVIPQYSLPYACVVVGDDIVCATELYQTIVELLEHYGFIINYSKTFHEGNFRESCGGDYYHGFDITPIYFPRKRWKWRKDKILAIDDLTSEKPDEQVSTLTSAISLAKRLYDYPLAQSIVVDFITSHTDQNINFTISDDIEEIGIKSKALLIEKFYVTPYAPLEPMLDHYDYVKKKGIYIDKPNPKHIRRVQESERKYLTPTVKNSIVCEYEKFRQGKSYDKSILSDTAISEIDYYLYTLFLADGPRFSDPFLKLLKVSDRISL